MARAEAERLARELRSVRKDAHSHRSEQYVWRGSRANDARKETEPEEASEDEGWPSADEDEDDVVSERHSVDDASYFEEEDYSRPAQQALEEEEERASRRSAHDEARPARAPPRSVSSRK